MTTEFDDIRPYTDEEIPSAMSRIASSQMLPLLASYVCPEQSLDAVRQMLLSFKSIHDFQLGIMYHVNEQIIANSITAFTYGGTEHIEKDRPYLLVSNHRDIMLKMFRVERPGGSIKDFYKSSLHLSAYIRHAICDQHESVWIAQRNGRTKDGNDQTDQGIIKMFCMSRQEDKIAALSELNILPVAVSYEWESCDILKAIELYESQKVKYIKKPGEDLNSILTGILQPKGRVHFEFCPMVTADELAVYNECTNNDYHKQVAHLIDNRIHRAYRLWPNNYIAHDMLYGQQRFRDQYTEAERLAFEKHLSKLDNYDSDLEVLRDLLLGIYANPVENKIKVNSEEL